MGKKKKKSIIRETQERLESMQAYGTKKHEDKKLNNGKPAKDKIYGYSTMKAYMDSCMGFARWARSERGCKNLDQAQQYAGEYLQTRINNGYSAWTVQRDACALSKLYQCRTPDFGIELPKRHRGDITQHRGSALGGSDAWKKQFNEEKNSDLVAFCKSTGLRRHEVAAIRPEDVTTHSDGSVTVHVLRGKGGKERTVTALNDTPARLAAQAQAANQQKLFTKIPGAAPIHMYRAEYAQSMYDSIARDISTLEPSDRYVARGDKQGHVYDRQALHAVSVQLGHNRLDVVLNYIK